MNRPALLLLLALGAAAQAQEVRRALPVSAASSEEIYENPAWMERVPVATPVEVRRALPVNAEPVPTPAPIATPLPEPAAPEVIDDAANIRIAPRETTSGAVIALDRANNLYARKLYDLAIPEYEVYLISGSTEGARDSALFRVAECHRMAGNTAAARAGYEKLVMEFKNGEFAAAGAYRLGEFLLDGKLYESAAIQFDLASREAKEPGVRLAASYFSARSLEFLKKNDAAEERYRAVIATEGENPYRENAAMALAALQLQGGKKQAALETLELLVDAGGRPDVTSASAMQAAQLARELGFTNKALKLYDKAAGASPDAAGKADAVLGALRLRYESGDYKGIIEMGEGIETKVPLSSKAEVLQILAAAHRQSGDEGRARLVYDRLVAEHPGAASSDTLYQRLLSLFATKDKSLPAEVDVFLRTATDPKQIASASLLKAESFFQQANYAAAARAYLPLIDNSALKKDQCSAALYKLAWSLAASGDNDGAIRAYSDFANKYPDNKLAPTAIVQRGLARQKTKAYGTAIADFDEVITRYQFSKEVEPALLQKALTCGQQKNYPEMAAAFQELLKRYPNSAAAAQANFWLGWAAYENKNYKEAVKFLDKARLLDPKNYAERATLRIILAEYQGRDRAAAARELDQYQGGPLPAEVVVWLAQGYLADKKPAKAEKILQPLAENPAAIPPEAWLMLAEARLALGKYEESAQAADKCLAAVQDPPARARGFIAKARADLGLNRTAAARQSADQALFLQPEGRLNAEARFVSGEIYFSEADYESAARAFMSLAVLTDDPEITPRALKRGAESYRRAEKDSEADNALKELGQRFPASALNTGS